MSDEMQLKAQEHMRQFNEKVYQISAENYALIFTRHLQTDEEQKREYTPVSKGKKGRLLREQDEKELEKLREQTDNKHIGLYGMRYINGATEQRRMREYYWKHATSKPDAELAKPDKDLIVFMKDDETAFKSNVDLLKAFGSGDQERIRPHLEEMMTMILTEDMAWGMLNEHWLADNAGAFYEKLERFRVFTRLYNENTWFKDSLTDDVKSLVESKLEEASLLKEGLKLSMERQGIEPETLTIKRNFHYSTNKNIRPERAIEKLLDVKKNEFKEALDKDFNVTKALRYLSEEEQNRVKEEAARTDAPENAEYRKAKRMIRDVPEEMQQGFEDALLTMAKDIGDYKPIPNDYRHFDTVTLELKYAAEDYYKLRGRMKTKGNKGFSLEEQVNSLLRLSAAAHAYRHVNGAEFNGTATDRKNCAGTIIQSVQELMDGCLDEETKRSAVEPLDHLVMEDDKETQTKVSSATVQIKQFHRAWKTWRVVLSKNNLDTPEERLIRYKTLFDDYRGILQLWVSNKELFNKYGDEKENAFAERALDEYTRINHELAFVDWARKQGDAKRIQVGTVDERLEGELKKVDDLKGFKPLDSAVDANLDEMQNKAVLETDQWMLRNVDKLDQSEMISKLLRKTKRERLYIYYLIESRARIKPTIEDFENSQKAYHPNLDVIKSHMVKSRFKFVSRVAKFFGKASIVYWEKLRQAMDICDGNRSLIREQYEPKTSEAKAEGDDAANEEAVAVRRRERAMNTRKALERYSRIKEECGEDKEKLQRRKEEIDNAAAEVKAAYEAMIRAEMNDKADTGSLRQDALDEANGVEKLAAFQGVGNLALKDLFGTAGAVAGGAVLIADGAIPLMLQMTDLCMQWPDISGAEMVSKWADITVYAGNVAETTVNRAGQVINMITGVSKEVAEKTAANLAKAGSVVTYGINIGAGLAQMAVQVNQAVHASSARELLKRKYESGQAKVDEREKKYDTQLRKLNEKIRAGKTEKAAAYLAGGALGLAAVLTPYATLFGALAFVAKNGLNLKSGSSISDGTLGLINGFTEIERMLPVIVAERRGWKKVENAATGRSLYRDTTGRFHEEREVLEGAEPVKIRRMLEKRIAARYNFNSYEAMLLMVAKRYAQFIHNKLFKTPDEDIDYYKELLKSFGLKYREPTEKDPGGPSMEQIAKKLMGK